MTGSASDVPEHVPPVCEFDPGRRLRQLRLELGLSQRELSRRAGMTNANLSMIEQGRVSPSLQTLERILRAIPISLVEFFRASDVASPVMFAVAEQARFSQPGGEFFVATKPGFDGQPILVRGYLKSGASITEIPTGPKFSWLSGIVVHGHLTLTLEKESWALEVGDAFQCHQNRAFRMENQGHDELCLTLVITPIHEDPGIKV